MAQKKSRQKDIEELLSLLKPISEDDIREARRNLRAPSGDESENDELREQLQQLRRLIAERLEDKP